MQLLPLVGLLRVGGGWGLPLAVVPRSPGWLHQAPASSSGGSGTSVDASAARRTHKQGSDAHLPPGAARGRRGRRLGPRLLSFAGSRFSRGSRALVLARAVPRAGRPMSTAAALASVLRGPTSLQQGLRARRRDWCREAGGLGQCSLAPDRRRTRPLAPPPPPPPPPLFLSHGRQRPSHPCCHCVRVFPGRNR